MIVKASIEKVNSAMKKISSAGGSVNIHGHDGNVSVKGVKANFSFDQENDTLTIDIKDKPFLVSQSFVEDEIRKFFK